MVYDPSEFEDVSDSERPDFLVRRRNAAAAFGVEITELFPSESDARVRQHENYVSRLLGGGSPMHKDDAVTLRVERVTVYSPEGEVKGTDVPGIIRQLLPLADYLAKLSQAIKDKNAKAVGYANEVSHINLIVIERSDRSVSPSAEIRISDLLVPELREALWASPFREVFFVTMIEESRRVFLPLRMLLLLTEFYLFVGALIAFEGGTDIAPEPEDVVPLFAQYARRAGWPVQLGKDESGLPVAVLGNSGVRVEREWRISILNYSDYMVQLDPWPKTEDPAIDDPSFLASLDAFKDSNAFLTEIAFDVLVDAPI